MCIRDRYQRRVHGDNSLREEEKKYQSSHKIYLRIITQKMEGMDLIDFSKEKKKKTTKKPKETDAAPKTDAAKAEDKPTEVKKEAADDRPKFVDPYTYEDLLERIYNQLKTNNPSLAEKTKFIMKPPQVVKIGARRSAWTNFADICKNMRRDPEHVSLFFLTELGTEGSVAQDQLSDSIIVFGWRSDNV
eukprot:TRINITY_DN1464_c0_g1_i4.p1 TRINITY_DN1464_c0_g1~~TRINITY_DN1464_c0_g1_i4.p1  ORF type:complete len:189 (-),score=77.86 TRINITY_DN1464_c0_g1_i4:252-818(-)